MTFACSILSALTVDGVTERLDLLATGGPAIKS